MNHNRVAYKVTNVYDQRDIHMENVMEHRKVTTRLILKDRESVAIQQSIRQSEPTAVADKELENVSEIYDSPEDLTTSQ